MFRGFEPDPEISDPTDPDFGTGIWQYEDGTSMYGQGDPEEARRLYKPPAPPPAREAPEPPPMLARPETAPVDQQTQRPAAAPAPAEPESSIRIPKASRIAYVHNNPGNLKYVGQAGASRGEPAEDGGHWAAFESPEDGIAALNRQVEIDAARGKTVGEFITKYAPPSSNDTSLYIQQASASLGADPSVKLADLPRDRVVAFMAQKESGTELGGSGLPEQSAARRAPGAGLPGSFQGMPAATAEIRGTPLSPEQLQANQQGVYDRTMSAAGAVQAATQARLEGREEALAVVQANHQSFMGDQQRQLQARTAAKLEAEQNIKTAMATQLDPGRLIKQMSTGDVILGAVALALGGLGQTLQQRGGQRGATNGALDMMQKAIDNDIEQQKEDKKSRVAHWTRVFGDEEMGIKAARAEMYNAAGQFAQFQAQQKATNADIQAQMLQDSAALMAKGQAEVQGLVDKENERVSIRYAPPPPPPAGAGAIDAFAKQLAARKAYEDAGATPEQLSAFDKAMGIPSPAGESVRSQKTREDKEAVARKDQELSESEGKAEAAWQTVIEFGKSVGLQRDPKTGALIVPDGFKGMQAPGLQEVVPGLLGKGKPIEAARRVAMDGLVRLQTGAAISESELKFYTDVLGDEDATRAEIATNLNALEALIQSRRKQSRVGAPGAPSSWK